LLRGAQFACACAKKAYLISGTKFGGPRFIVGASWLANSPIPSKAEVTAAINLCESSTMKIVRFEGNREAREALTLSVVGVMAIMLVWNLMMLLWY
jgi:adenosine/AMP kinase